MAFESRFLVAMHQYQTLAVESVSTLTRSALHQHLLIGHGALATMPS